MRLPTSSGPLLVKTGTGGLMGDPFMVHMFGRAFAVPVSAWQLEQRGFDDCYAALYCKCPVNNKPVDLSLTKYADDLVKMVMVKDGDGWELARKKQDER